MLNVAAAVLAMTLVVGQGEEVNKQWIKFLAGTWEVTDPEGREYETRIESVSGGARCLARRHFPTVCNP